MKVYALKNGISDMVKGVDNIFCKFSSTKGTLEILDNWCHFECEVNVKVIYGTWTEGQHSR